MVSGTVEGVGPSLTTITLKATPFCGIPRFFHYLCGANLKTVKYETY